MSKLAALLTLVVAVLASGNVSAGDLEFDLVAETRLGEQLTDAREACEANEQAGNIEGIATGSPSMFHGIGPQSSRWPDARAAYLRYAVSTCVPKDTHGYVAIAASLYEQALSKEELAIVLNFYKTDAGKKFAEVSTRLSGELNKRMYEESQEALKQGGIRFESEMQEIKSREK